MIIVVLIILTVVFCKTDTPANVEADPCVCIDIHNQPPYPELGDDVDLPAILDDMAANNVSNSILSAYTLMRYSMELANFVQANPNRILAAVRLKLTCMGILIPILSITWSVSWPQENSEL